MAEIVRLDLHLALASPFVKLRACERIVVPAKAGTQGSHMCLKELDSRLRGNDKKEEVPISSQALRVRQK